MVHGNGTGVLQLWNSIRSLFTIDLLCSQNVSGDWWNRRTFFCSSVRIPVMAEHGSASAAYTHKHLIWRPWPIISSILSSATPTDVSFPLIRCSLNIYLQLQLRTTSFQIISLFWYILFGPVYNAQLDMAWSPRIYFKHSFILYYTFTTINLWLLDNTFDYKYNRVKSILQS